MASSISDIGALKSCVLLDILALWGFRHSSIVTAFIAIFQIHFSCYDEKREKMTLQFLQKKKKINLLTKIAKLFKMLTVHMLALMPLLFSDIITYIEHYIEHYSSQGPEINILFL